MRTALSPIVAALGLALTFAGCQTMDTISQVGTTVGVATGTITPEQAESINRTSSAVGKTFDSLTPEQEYYIGRSVAAVLLNAYKPYDNATVNTYLNTIGQALAQASDRPETFGGYHFLTLDTDEINAFAAPGGLILVSRGLLRCCPSEDAVAAVLAHEVAHVELKHGLQAIKKDRLVSAFTILGSEAAKNLGGQDLANLTTEFEGSITDVTSTMANSGYSRKFEDQADAAAVTTLQRIGYDPRALVVILQEMEKRVKPEAGFGKTHPAPKDRIQAVNRLIGAQELRAVPAGRAARFDRALAGI